MISPLDADIQRAISQSRLASLPHSSLERLVATAKRVAVPARTVVYRDGYVAAPALVIAGLLRLFVSAPDGRQATVLYARRGQLLGSGLVVRDHVPGNAQAITDIDLLLFDPRVFRDLAMSDAAVAFALVEAAIDMAYGVAEELGWHTFASTRERVARHLVSLATSEHDGGAPVVQVSAQGLADAVGTVREVVARTLRQMEADGLVQRGRDGITLVRPEELHLIGWPGGHHSGSLAHG